MISGRKLTENYRLLRGLAAPHTALVDVSAQGFDLPQHNLAAAALTREQEVCTICALWVVRLPPNAGGDKVLRWCLIIGTIIASATLVAAMLFIGSVIGWRLY